MPDLERIQQLTPGTLSQQWYEDGTAVDPGTVTVGITRADGTVLVAPGAATAGSGTAARTFSLTTTHTALLDRLTVTWASSSKGTLVSYVEVVGGFLFSLAELAAVKPATLTWTAAQKTEMRTRVEDTIERACARAFVPRYARETLSGTSTSGLLLANPDIRAIRDITVDGTAYSVSELANVAFNPSGVLNITAGAWTAGYSNVVVAYEHGMDFTPPRVTQAALLLARSWLVTGPVDNRALGQSSPTGEFSFGLAVPGRNGSYVGLPEVDAVIGEYSMQVGVA